MKFTIDLGGNRRGVEMERGCGTTATFELPDRGCPVSELAYPDGLIRIVVAGMGLSGSLSIYGTLNGANFQHGDNLIRKDTIDSLSLSELFTKVPNNHIGEAVCQVGSIEIEGRRILAVEGQERRVVWYRGADTILIGTLKDHENDLKYGRAILRATKQGLVIGPLSCRTQMGVVDQFRTLVLSEISGSQEYCSYFHSGLPLPGGYWLAPMFVLNATGKPELSHYSLWEVGWSAVDRKVSWKRDLAGVLFHDDLFNGNGIPYWRVQFGEFVKKYHIQPRIVLVETLTEPTVLAN